MADPTATPDEDHTEVLVIGSGFGGAVATLRFAEAGHQVVVLERGDRVRRDRFQADLDVFWKPHRAAYGFHDLQARGKPIIPWIGAAVGGGSHVYAGTLKRRDDWDGFPAAIGASDMTGYYDRAEAILGGAPYPDWEPYRSVRATQLMFQAGQRLQAQHPELVEDWGPVHLGISFAPEGGTPGAEFVNPHGCTQRYYDPREQSILGGDIDAKNSLDRNYLFLAERAAKPAEIRPLCEADRIERLPDGRYRVHYVRHVPPPGGWATVRRRWLPWRPPPQREPHTIVADRVVVAAGAVGSSELLLRNRDVHATLPELGPHVGQRYTSNGDYLTLIIPFRGLWLSWLGFVAMVVCLILHQWWGAGAGALAYYAGLLVSRPSYDPDLGTTNSDNIRFKGPDGKSQGAYIESGRYPTPGGVLVAMMISGITGRFRPRSYRRIHAVSRVLRVVVPPLGALARTYPIPLLSMGRDHAFGTFRLTGDGRAVIDYDTAANRDFYGYLEKLGKLVGKAAGAYWLPHVPFKLLGRMEVPHNQGGVPMGTSPDDGVVDHAGRVFGLPNLIVLDGSIIPVSVGPNPALTITAIAERAMDIVLAQVAGGGDVVAAPAEERAA
ncbi:MAG: GMC family oxidoreductase [Myxococcales bacterium]|nr:GMC family oxidoreductase [Myxococcales bacterium]